MPSSFHLKSHMMKVRLPYFCACIIPNKAIVAQLLSYKWFLKYIALGIMLAIDISVHNKLSMVIGDTEKVTLIVDIWFLGD